VLLKSENKSERYSFCLPLLQCRARFLFGHLDEVGDILSDCSVLAYVLSLESSIPA
jgi:hypothetical protein